MLFEMDAGGSGAICFFVGGVIFAICHLLSFPSNLPNQSSRAVHIYNVIKPPCPSSWIVISNFLSLGWWNIDWSITIVGWLQYCNTEDPIQMTRYHLVGQLTTQHPLTNDMIFEQPPACLFICKQATSLMTSSDTHEKHDNIKPWNENY